MGTPTDNIPPGTLSTPAQQPEEGSGESLGQSATSATARGPVKFTLPHEGGAPYDDSVGNWTLAQLSAAADLLNAAHVERAAERLSGLIVRTPVLRKRKIDELVGAEVWLKCENLQHIGAFKARGALHMISRLPAEVAARGLVTYSSGNHGQAVAYAAWRRKIPATVVMPQDAAVVKVAAIRELGAKVEFAGTTSAERKLRAHDLARKNNLVIVPPFDHPDIIAGQGTAALELCEHVATHGEGRLDAIYVPVGGGGLLAGTCLVARSQGVEVIAVEPENCEAFRRSQMAGRVVEVVSAPSIADGLRPVRVGELNFAIAERDVRKAMVVSDASIADALVHILRLTKTLVEPSGAAALAGAMRDVRTWKQLDGGRRPRIGVILSGGNFGLPQLAEMIAKG